MTSLRQNRDRLENAQSVAAVDVKSGFQVRSSGPQETHPTGGQRITGKTTISIDDPDQVRGQGSRVVNGDGETPACGKRGGTWRHD